ncbi:MAG: DUF4443 domain-containing protein [Nanobdellota archaeon]
MVDNPTNLHSLDRLRVLLRLSTRKSRSTLSEETGIGEGILRSILDDLKEKGLTISSRAGHVLSDKGKKTMKKIERRISLPRKVDLKAFYPEQEKTAIRIKQPEGKKDFVTLRDEAVKNGGEGAMIFECRERLYLPGHEGRFPSLEEEFDLKRGDLLIIAFAHQQGQSEKAALSVTDKLCFISAYIS